MDAASEATERERASADGPSRDLLTRLRVALARAGIGPSVSRALMVAAVIAITGGFVIDAGPLYLSRPSSDYLRSSLRLPRMLLRVLPGPPRRRCGRCRALRRSLHRHALAIAVVLAAVAAGVGIGFGTYVVAASDPSAYVSQARLIAKGDLVVRGAARVACELARCSEWSFAPLGYRPGLTRREWCRRIPLVSRCRWPSALFVAGENGTVSSSVPFFAALTVFGAYGLAVRLHSRTAGVIAAVLHGDEPVAAVRRSSSSMSDIPATALWTLALLAATGRAADRCRRGVGPGVARAAKPSSPRRRHCLAAGDLRLDGRWPREAFAALVRFACGDGARQLRPSRGSSGAFTAVRLRPVMARSARCFPSRTCARTFAPTRCASSRGETPALALIAASVVALVARRLVPAGLESKTRPHVPLSCRPWSRRAHRDAGAGLLPGLRRVP